MLQKLFPLIGLVLVMTTANAQLSRKNTAKIIEQSTELSELSFEIVNGESGELRWKANREFIPKLVNALKIKGSFNYKFHELQTISKIYPKDSSFRVFTWQMTLDNGEMRHYGFLQHNKEELDLHPFFDFSDSLYFPINEPLNNEKWYGAIYYNIMTVESGGKKYYCLFGLDYYDYGSTRKLIEVLHFDEAGKPLFGAPIFSFPEGEGSDQQLRHIIEYKKGSLVTLNYSKEHRMVIFDHLVPMDPKANDLRFTFVPDGTYHGFMWKNGKWTHVNKVFHYSIDDHDNPPLPDPVNFKKENAGNLRDSK